MPVNFIRRKVIFKHSDPLNSDNWTKEMLEDCVTPPDYLQIQMRKMMKTETVEKLNVPEEILPIIDQGLDQIRSERDAEEKKKNADKKLAAQRNLRYEMIVKESLPEIFRKYVETKIEWRFKSVPEFIQPDELLTIKIPGLPEFQMKYSANKWLYRIQEIKNNFDDWTFLDYPKIFTEDEPVRIIGKLAMLKIEIDAAKQIKTEETAGIPINVPVYVDDDPTINSDLPDQPQKDYDSLAYEFINIADNLIDSRLAFHGLL